MATVDESFSYASTNEQYVSTTNEFANATTHGIGLVCSVAGAIMLVVAAHALDSVSYAGIVVYATSLIAVYALSTMSHVVQQPRARHLFRVWDQGTIYLLIAGTYTPLLVHFGAGWTSGVALATVWLAALIGFASKIFGQHRVDALHTWSYVLLGWLPAVMFAAQLQSSCFAWIVCGGVSYTLGTVFLKLDERASYFHSIWHVFVMIGSACHFYAIYRYTVIA